MGQRLGSLAVRHGSLPGGGGKPEEQRRGHSRGGQHARPVAPHILPDAVHPAGRTGQHGLIHQVPPDIGRQFRNGWIAPLSCFFNRLQNDPVQIAGHQAAQRHRVRAAAFGYLGRGMAQLGELGR